MRTPLLAIQISFWRGSRRAFRAFAAEPLTRWKNAAACRLQLGKSHHPDRPWHVIIDCFEAAPQRIGFVPEASASRVSQKSLPPLAMRFGARPPLQRFKIAPILPHTRMQRKQREK